MRDKFETLWLSYRQEHKIEYKIWGEIRKEFSIEGVDLPPYLDELPHPIITALYSAKYGKPIVWKFKTFIQVAHIIESGHKKYLHYFRRALATYDRAAQLRSEDESGKWKAKVDRYKKLIAQNDPAYTPDTTYNGLIEILFPEIFEK